MVGIVDKNVSLFVESQYPAIYKESGQELIALTKEYYKWLEETTNQSTYNARRMFEYRDIATTQNEMLLYFKNKYMADLPLDEAGVKVLVRNILDLYQRKGSASGIKLFFQMFYNKDVEVVYPAANMLKVSDSKWKTGNYLQMYPNNNQFFSPTGEQYDYSTLLSRNITGSFSGAKAAVDKINTILLNGILTPIIYIDQVRGSFQKYDQLLTIVNGVEVGFGFVNGSMNFLDVDDQLGIRTVGNEVGDIVNVTSPIGTGGTAVVTKISEDIDGQVKYDLQDGGWGYSLEETRLLSSNQLILLDNSAEDFEIYERLSDTNGTSGVVTGQTTSYVAVRIDTGTSFSLSYTVSTVDRNPNITVPAVSYTVLNSSAPGNLEPDTGLSTDVRVESISNSETVSLITDLISPYVSVALNAADYGASTPMSGSASPVNINTVLEDAFDLQDITIGTIDALLNVNPGTAYTNDVKSVLQDSLFSRFDRRDQNIIFTNSEEVFDFSIGNIITETGTGRQGIVREINSNGYLRITPYTYYGFDSQTNDILRDGIVLYSTIKSEQNYDSPKLGENAVIASPVAFEIGTIEEVAVQGSGFGYPDGTYVQLTRPSDGSVRAEAVVTSQSQGTNSGYWSNFNSHINGYTKTLAEDGEDFYYDSQKKVQDSDYLQEYSYELKSAVNPADYMPGLLENVHLAGTKVFNQFLFKNKVGISLTSNFIRYFNDDGQGSIFDTQDINAITSDILNFTVDSTILTSDNVNTI